MQKQSLCDSPPNHILDLEIQYNSLLPSSRHLQLKAMDAARANQVIQKKMSIYRIGDVRGNEGLVPTVEVEQRKGLKAWVLIAISQT